MDYSISQLLEDSKLRGEVLQAGLTVEDHTGQFDCLDFSQSMLKNHRAVFDRLCELGGDELLGKLLKKGGTCLTDDPNAAKQGVRPIKGTDKYFLKTNAGASTALGSILAGLAGWLAESEQEEDSITFHAEGEENEEEGACSLPDHDGLFPVLPPRRLSLVQKDGKYAFFDEEAKEFASFSITFFDRFYEQGSDSVSEFALCQLMDEEHPEWGWKYKLTEDEDAKWGWISGCGRHCTEPCFENFFHSYVSISITEDSCGTDYGTCSIHRPVDPEGNSFPTDTLCCFAESWSLKLYFLFPDGDAAPWRMESIEWVRKDRVSFERLFIEKDSDGVLFTADGEFGLYTNGIGSHYLCDFSPIVWTLTDSDDKGSVYRLPASRSLTPCECSRILEYGGQYSEGLSWLGTQCDQEIYALRREGWWAVGVWSDNHFRLLTPYSFTGEPKVIATLHESGIHKNAPPHPFLLVDRFGKKGVLNCQNGSYPVPCDYEKISFCPTGWSGGGEDDIADGFFTVKRMGYMGTINLDGTWNTQLHREE